MFPGRDEARAMLQVAEEAEDATRNPPLSWVFFIIQAVLVAVICCAQVLPGRASVVVSIVGFVVLVGVGMRWVFLRPGYGIVGLDGAGAFPFMMAAFVTVGIPAVFAIGFDLSWLWLVAGALAGAIVLEMGRRYRRAVGRV